MDLNPFHYSLAQVQKALVALVVAGVAIAGYFVVFDPGFQQAATLVVTQVFAVIAVFATTNHTAADVQKAVMALLGGVLGLVALFTTVDPNTAETVGGIVLAVLQVYGVFKTSNAGTAAA